MPSSWGNSLKISLYGESHGGGIGVVMDNVPPGEPVDEKAVLAFMARRAPGHTPWSTPRKEDDLPRVLSGIYQGQTTGTPISAFIENTNTRSGDYAPQADVPRPGHADYTGFLRYQGANDPRGGGHFSGRVTAGLCFAGALCDQMLKRRGITVVSRVKEIAGVSDVRIDPANPEAHLLEAIGKNAFPTADRACGALMAEKVEQARLETDSVGGIVQCFVLGLPAGVGDPMFGGVEPVLASLLYGIPAVKGVSFGDGFEVCRRRGSQNNDALLIDEKGNITTRTNHGGGSDGGITNGMPLVFDVGIKPTASISQPLDSVNLSTLTAEQKLTQGRHDPCIVPRAAAVVHAAAAIAVMDLLITAYGVQGIAAGEGTPWK